MSTSNKQDTPAEGEEGEEKSEKTEEKDSASKKATNLVTASGKKKLQKSKKRSPEPEKAVIEVGSFSYGDNIRIIGLQGTPELNNEIGCFVKIDSERGRLVLKLRNQKNVSVKLQNCIKVDKRVHSLNESLEENNKDNSTLALQACNHCGHDYMKRCTKLKLANMKLRKCAVCFKANFVVFYCSKECQKASWTSGHKQVCGTDKAQKLGNNKALRPSLSSYKRDFGLGIESFVHNLPQIVEARAGTMRSNPFKTLCMEGLACSICSVLPATYRSENSKRAKKAESNGGILCGTCKKAIYSNPTTLLKFPVDQATGIVHEQIDWVCSKKCMHAF
jgi:hypothetical protein